MLRNADTGDWIGTFEGHKGAVWSGKLNSTATLAATASADYTVKVWDSVSGDCLQTMEHKHIVKSVDFSKDDTRLASGGTDKLLRIFDVARLDAAPVELAHVEQKIRKVLWTADGRRVLTGGDDGILRVWDLASGAVVQEVALTDTVMDMELSRDGVYLTTAAGSNVTVFNAETLVVHAAHALATPVECATICPSNPSRVAVGGADMQLRVIEVATGEEVSLLRGHHGPVHCARYSPAGETLASGAGDSTIRLWPTKG